MAADKIVPIGLAMFWFAMSGADWKREEGVAEKRGQGQSWRSHEYDWKKSRMCTDSVDGLVETHAGLF